MAGTCCSLASVTGISGVTLTGGQSYFMVLQPVSYGDTSWNSWFFNNQSATGDQQYSVDGVSWNDIGNGPAQVFDVLGGGGAVAAPEPATLLLFGSGLAAILLARYQKRAAR